MKFILSLFCSGVTQPSEAGPRHVLRSGPPLAFSLCRPLAPLPVGVADDGYLVPVCDAKFSSTASVTETVEFTAANSNFTALHCQKNLLLV